MSKLIKTFKTILIGAIIFFAGMKGVPMYNSAVIERDRQVQEMAQQKARFEKAVKDSQRGFLGKMVVVPIRDLINKF